MKSKRVFAIAVLATLLAVAQGAPQDHRYKNYEEHHREAYFNGSAFLKLSSFVSVHRHSGLSFRTCDPGRLFLQRYNDDNSISLDVTPDGLLFVAMVDQQRYKARLSARLLNNVWHNVNLFFRLGNLTLNAAGHTQVKYRRRNERTTVAIPLHKARECSYSRRIFRFVFFFRSVQVVANATYNSAVLTLTDYDVNSSLIVGDGFKGCILQGPGFLFNDSINSGAVFGPCPSDTRGCKNHDHVVILQCAHSFIFFSSQSIL